MPETIDNPELMFGSHTARDAAATFYHVGKMLDTGYGPVSSRPDPDSPDEFSVISYSTLNEPYSSMKLTPIGGDLTGEYRVTAYPDHISILEKRTKGDKAWMILEPGDSVPAPYCDAVYDVERRIELGKQVTKSIESGDDVPNKFLSVQ